MKKSILLCSILMFVALMFPFSVIEGAAAKQPLGQPESILNPEEAQLRAEAECWDKYDRGFDAAEAKYNKINNDRRQPNTRKEVARGAFQRAVKGLSDALDRCLAKERTPEKKLERIQRWARWNLDEQKRKAEEDYDNARKKLGGIRNPEAREQARRNAVRDRSGAIDAAEQEYSERTKNAKDEYEEEHRAELAGLNCDQLATRKEENYARYKAAVRAAGNDITAQMAAADEYFKEDQQLDLLVRRCLAQRPRSLPLDPDAQPDEDVVASTPLKNIKQVAGSSNLARLIQGYVKAQNKHTKELETKIAAAMRLSGDKRIIALEKAIGLNHQVLSQSVNDTIKKFQESRNVKPTPQRIIAKQPKTSTSKREKGACELAIAGLTSAYTAYLKQPTDAKLNIVDLRYRDVLVPCPKDNKDTVENPTPNCPAAAEAPSTDCSNERTASLEYYRAGLGEALQNYTDVLKKTNIDSLTQLVNTINAQELQTSIRDVLLQAINAELSRSETVASGAEDTLTAKEKTVSEKALNAPLSPINSGSLNNE